MGHTVGWPVIVLGVLFGVWAVREVEAADVNVESPDNLVTTGPYAISRNPMYVAWTIIVVGTTLVANTLWPLILLPIIVLLTHFVDVLGEEDFLDKQFGDEYRRYRSRVRRYF
jgi:protein-S-isoprenylcysteine O-methyltransferase Ste14